MKKIFYLITWFLLAWIADGLYAQSAVLDSYVKQGLEANLRLSKQQLSIDQQRYKAEGALSNNAFVVDVKTDYTVAFGGRMINFPIGDLFNPIHGTLNELTGSAAFPTNLENENIQFFPNNFYDARVQVSKPIINPSITYAYQAESRLISVQEARALAIEADLKRDIQVAYLNYLKTIKVKEIYDSTEVFLRELLRVNQKLVKYDKATEDAVASVEYELEKLNSDRMANERDQQLAESYFNSLLNRDLDLEILIDKQLDFPVRIENIDELERRALEKSPELLQIREGIKANQLVEVLQEKMYQPTLGIQVSAGFQGLLDDINSDHPYVLAGLGFNWTIYDGKKKRLKIEQARVQTRQLNKDLEMARQQIQLRVKQAWYYLDAAEKGLEAERAALRSAARSFRIIRNRYEADAAILLEYLDARTKYTNAIITVSIAQYEVMIRQVELNRAIADI